MGEPGADGDIREAEAIAAVEGGKAGVRAVVPVATAKADRRAKAPTLMMNPYTNIAYFLNMLMIAL